MASTTTQYLGLEIPAHGDYAATGWDTPMNNSLRSLDTAYGGYLSLSLTGGVHQLSIADASNPVIYLSGTLTSDQYLYFPLIAGRRILIVGVTLNGYVLYVRGNNGSDTNGIYFWNGFGIPYAISVTPSRVYWDYGGTQPGLLADMPTGWAGNGWLPCDGRWVNMGLHDLLYDSIGGTYGISGTFPSGAFKLPDYRGTVLAMADQIGTVPGAGPYAVNQGSRGILNNWGFTTTNYGGEANHQLSVAEMPGHVHDASHGHTASASDSGHQHPGVATGGINPGGIIGGAVGGGQLAIGETGVGYAQVSVSVASASFNTGGAGGWQPHNNVQPTCTTMKMIKW